MRLQQRNLTGDALREAVLTLEIIEDYPEDKYLPSFLVRGEARGLVFHVHVATDVESNNIRVVTIYVPNTKEWENGGRIRRKLR